MFDHIFDWKVQFKRYFLLIKKCMEGENRLILAWSMPLCLNHKDIILVPDSWNMHVYMHKTYVYFYIIYFYKMKVVAIWKCFVSFSQFYIFLISV